MRQIYVVGNHRFVAESAIDSTMIAVDYARNLMKSGKQAEANALYQEALKVRREIESTMETAVQSGAQAFRRVEAAAKVACCPRASRPWQSRAIGSR